MILSRDEVKEIITGHEWDNDITAEDIKNLAKSHEILREYALRSTSLINSNSNKVSAELMMEFLKLIPIIKEGNQDDQR